MAEIVQKHVCARMVLDVIKSPVAVRVHQDISVRHVNMVGRIVCVDVSNSHEAFLQQSVGLTPSASIALKLAIAQWTHPMDVIHKPVDADVKLDLLVTIVTQVCH